MTRSPWLGLLVICLGFFLILLDTTIVNIAVPTLIGSLHASLDQVLWVLNGYSLAFTVLLIPGGRLGDVLGRRAVLVAGLVLFTLASAACAATGNAAELIAARVLQGVGGGLLAPQALALITTLFPKGRRGAALGVFGAASALSLISGPIIGGALIGHWGWRAVFAINVPLGVLVLAGTLAVLAESRADRPRGLDPVGVVLVAAGLSLVVFALLESQRTGGAPPGWQLAVVAGVALVALFVAWELRHPFGLVPLALFQRRTFVIGSWVASCLGFALLGSLLPLVLLFQEVLGLTALGTALALTPVFVGMLVSAPVAGRLADRVGGGAIFVAGSLAAAAALVLVVSQAAAGAGAGGFTVPLLVAGLGIGACTGPLFLVAMADVPEDDSGAASGFVSATRAVGQVLGVAAVGALIQNRLAAGLGYAGAVRPALWVGVVVLLLAAASSVAVVRRGPT